MPAKILIVEDEDFFALKIQDSLKSLGYGISGIASTGEEAVEKTGETRPDLVLMDIVLKGKMDGVEAAEHIHERFDTPVVYLTGLTSDEITERAKITEPFGYILKPFQDRELHTVIEIALYKHRMEEEIRKLNAELEKRVEERTRQLLEAQEELVRQEKLALVGRIAGRVGHEIRNPLGVISNSAFYLKTILKDANETTKEYLDIITNEVAASERIVSDLIAFTSIKAPHKMLINIGEIVIHSLKTSSVPNNIIVKAEIPASLPEVSVDPMQLGQVFVNIIKNAAEEMSRGGNLKIEAEEDRESGEICVSMTDTGPGISPENMKKLFQPLFTTKSRGLGLGLAMVKSLAEANGGRIEVSSEVGKGTKFRVILPVG